MIAARLHASKLAACVAVIGCAAFGCASDPAPPPATPPASSAAASEPSPDAASAEPARTWKELYADAPKTELDTTGQDEATAAKTRKQSVDIEVTYRELAKVVQKAPVACPIAQSGCSDDWTRYVTELAAVKQRIDRPTTSCGDSPERAVLLEHHEYQTRAYQAHVEKLTAEMKGAEGAAAFQRLLQAAEKKHSTPGCVEPGQ